MGWLDNAKNWVSEQARTAEVAAQGVTRGLASGVAGVGDLAVGVGYNWTVRHLTGGEKYETNYADRAANAVTWTEAKNDRERAIMAGGQVVGEVAGFVAVTVATGGIGGAAVGGGLAVARGGAAVRAVTGAVNSARSTSVAAETVAGASRAASATARVMNPLSSKLALGIEGGFGAWRGHDLYTTDQNAAIMADTVRTKMAQTVIDTAINEQTALNNSAQRVQQGLGAVIEQLNNPDLSDEDHAALITRLDTLDAHNTIIQELQSDETTPERREELWNELKAADPAVEGELNPDNTASNSIFGTEFKNAADGIQATAPAAAEPGPKQIYNGPVINNTPAV